MKRTQHSVVNFRSMRRRIVKGLGGLSRLVKAVSPAQWTADYSLLGQGLVNIGLRSIASALLLVLLAVGGCNRPKRASSESGVSLTRQGIRASITAHAPDAFYDPPSD